MEPIPLDCEVAINDAVNAITIVAEAMNSNVECLTSETDPVFSSVYFGGIRILNEVREKLSRVLNCEDPGNEEE